MAGIRRDFNYVDNQYGGVNVGCARCPGAGPRVVATQDEAEEWWTIHSASIAHREALPPRPVRKRRR